MIHFYRMLPFVVLSLILVSCNDRSSSSDESGGTSSSGSVQAYSTAEGGGEYSVGGRGGSVLHVTSLEDDGVGNTPGQFRHALLQRYARTIVFDTCGTIYLKSPLTLNAKTGAGKVTIAGQTAPGGGITIAGQPVYFEGLSDITVQFVRFRLGDINAVAGESDDYDAFGAQNCSNLLIDHCSISWGIDECASFYGNTNFTMQWCIIAEALNKSTHTKGAHGYGGIWGGKNASFHHNLIMSCNSRNPRFDHDYVSTLRGPIDYVNNVVYNWGENSSYGGENREINIENNYYKSGPASSHKYRIFNPTTECSYCYNLGITDQAGRYFITGNYVYGYPAVTSDNWSGVEYDNGVESSQKTEMIASSAFSVTAVAGIQTAQNAYLSVLAHAGDSYSRDAVDTRLISEVENGIAPVTKGSNGSSYLIDSQDDVGGYPTLLKATHATDSDLDGIPDEWETSHSLNKDLKSDGNSMTLDSEGKRTNLEMYLYDLVKSFYY